MPKAVYDANFRPGAPEYAYVLTKTDSGIKISQEAYSNALREAGCRNECTK